MVLARGLRCLSLAGAKRGETYYVHGGFGGRERERDAEEDGEKWPSPTTARRSISEPPRRQPRKRALGDDAEGFGYGSERPWGSSPSGLSVAAQRANVRQRPLPVPNERDTRSVPTPPSPPLFFFSLAHCAHHCTGDRRSTAFVFISLPRRLTQLAPAACRLS